MTQPKRNTRRFSCASDDMMVIQMMAIRRHCAPLSNPAPKALSQRSTSEGAPYGFAVATGIWNLLTASNAAPFSRVWKGLEGVMRQSREENENRAPKPVIPVTLEIRRKPGWRWSIAETPPIALSRLLPQAGHHLDTPSGTPTRPWRVSHLRFPTSRYVTGLFRTRGL